MNSQANKKLRMTCSNCGGENVSCDATVQWDIDQQDWIISGIHDGDFCDDCEDETRIIEKEIGQ